MAELFEADLEDRLAGAHERVIAGDVGDRQPRDLLAHRLGIAAVIERFAVRETNAVERRNRTQLDVIGEPAAAKLPELFKQERRGDDGRTGVEGESVLAVDIGSAARRIELLEHRDPIAAGAQAHGRGKTTKTTANYHRMGRPTAFPGAAHPAGKIGCKPCHTFECNKKLTLG